MKVKFTESSVQSLLAGWHSDTAQPGLSLYVGTSGTRTFYWYRWVTGKGPTRQRLDVVDAISLSTARKTVERMNGAKANGADPSDARRAAAKVPTLGEVASQYFAERESRGARSVANMRALSELYFLRLPDVERKRHGQTRNKPAEGVDWSKRKIDSIAQQEVTLLHKKIGKRVPTTANRVAEVLSAIYGFARRASIASTNPAVGIDAFKEAERSRFIREDELPNFFEALDTTPQPWQDFFRVLLATGARRGAVQAMQWADIDLNQQLWYIPVESSKSGRQLVIPLTTDACVVLRRRREATASAWVFAGESAAGHITQPKKAWAALLMRAGLADLHLHDVRRSLGSWMAMSGASLPMIGSALGHGANLSATGVYARLASAPVRQAMERAQEHIRLGATKVKPKLRAVV